MSRGSVTLTIVPDVSRFTAAVEAARRAFGKLGAAIIEAGKAFLTLGRPLDIVRFGPRNLADDGTWQSDLCAAWVHSSCPSAFCDCTCHGGTVR